MATSGDPLGGLGNIFPFDVVDLFFNNSKNLATDWFKAIAGQIASGLEAAGVAFLLDIWKVIKGPIEILAGVILIFIGLGIAFSNDIAGVAVAGMRAGML